MLLSYDIETTGLRLHSGHKMFSYSTCDEKENVKICRLDGSSKRKIKSKLLLKRILKNRNPLIMHNAKFDLTGTENFLDMRFPRDYPFHDTFIQSNLLQNNHPNHKLKDLAWELAGIDRDDERAIKGFKNYQDVPEYLMDEYQRRDAVRTMLLHKFFYPKIKAKGLTEIYETELALERATMSMERRGLQLSIKACEKMIGELREDVELCLDRLENYCNKRINPNRDADVRWLLYKFAGYPILKRTPKTKEPSTEKDIILQLREKKPNPALELLLQFRSWSRGITTLKKYITLADDEGILHPEIKTCGAVTGREACKTPNLQNVAKSTTLLNPYPVMARKVFKPRKGYVNFHIDYAGIELRLLLHYSEEPKMIEEINDPDGDPHRLAADVFYLDKFTKLTDKAKKKSLRDAAKNANFAIPYGAGAMVTASTLGLYGREGLEAHKRYCQAFPKLSSLHNDLASEVREEGFVKTAFGRILFIPRDKAYMGTNYIIQGTAAGVLKRAQVRVYDYLEKATGGEVQILLPIHDEIIIEYPRKRLREAPGILREVKKLMEDFSFKVPLEVEMEVATNSWEDKKEYKLEDL